MLRKIQKKRICDILRVSDSSPWKVLIIDTRTQDILSPLLKINELRECNITTHFLLNATRHRIKDTPAVYFIESSEKSISVLISDISRDLYSNYYINFSNSISRILLERLANELSLKSKGLFVKSLCDQYLGFTSLQDNLFSLNFTNTFLNPADNNLIAESLFGVFLTLKEPPFIVIDNKTEQIGKLLLKKIKNTNLIKDTRKKPLLIITDRNFDLKTPIEHVWTYGALINDILDFKLNKVTIGKDMFDLDPSDEFWLKNSEEYFPVVTERVEQELVDYKKEMALRCMDEKSDKKQIEEALEKAPELARKKSSMHVHLTICMALVEAIKNRSIDDFYRIEKNSYKKQDILEISEKGENEDILRLGVSMLRTDNLMVVKALLKDRKIDSKILSFFENNVNFDSKVGTSYRSVVSNLLGTVKKLLPCNNDSPLSKYVEGIVNSIKNQNIAEINLINPFGSHCFEQEISKIVVFCNGGGTYTELKSLNELGRKLNLEIVYGSTEIVNSKVFLDQLKKIQI